MIDPVAQCRLSQNWAGGGTASSLEASARAAWLSLLVLSFVLPSLAIAAPEGELSFHRAVAAFGAGDYDSAREGFEEKLRVDPNDSSALHYLGLIEVQRGEIEAAIRYLEQAVAGDPSNVPARVDLAAQYLKRKRDRDALDQLDVATELDPDNALALLYQGIALYRVGAFDEAIRALNRAAELEPRLSNEVSYYTGLSKAYLGDAQGAAAAFDTAASGSPQSPLGRSATTLRSQAGRNARIWSLAAVVGLEYNNNVRLSPAGETDFDLADTSKSGAAVARLQGQVEAYGNDAFSWRMGYDGYLQIYWSTDETELTMGRDFSAYDLSQQTHVAWTNATYDTRFASFALRYDFSFTAIDLSEPFRTIQRVAPTVYVPISEWGLFLGFYQFLYYDYDVELTDPIAFDRTGPQHSVGAQQFVFLPDPINYLVVGALWTTFDSDGTEFRHEGIEGSFGGEVNLPWEWSTSLLYRFSYRSYSEYSAVTPSLAPRVRRRDKEHEISFSLDRSFIGRIKLSIAGSYAHNSSNIENFDINRFIIGSYLRYVF